jgi:hypothetical protein
VTYTVEVPEPVEEKIEAWNLRKDVHARLFETIIRDLSELRLNGYRSVAPVIFQIHRIVFECPEKLTLRRFKLWVDEVSVQGTRRVLDIRELDDDSPYAGMFRTVIVPDAPSLPSE